MLSIIGGIIILYLLVAGICILVFEADPYEAFLGPIVAALVLGVAIGLGWLGVWLIYSGLNGGI